MLIELLLALRFFAESLNDYFFNKRGNNIKYTIKMQMTKSSVKPNGRKKRFPVPHKCRRHRGLKGRPHTIPPPHPPYQAPFIAFQATFLQFHLNETIKFGQDPYYAPPPKSLVSATPMVSHEQTTGTTEANFNSGDPYPLRLLKKGLN